MGEHAASLRQYYYTVADHPTYASMLLGELLKQMSQWLTFLALFAKISHLSSTPSVSLSLFLLARRLPYLLTVGFTGAPKALPALSRPQRRCILGAGCAPRARAAHCTHSNCPPLAGPLSDAVNRGKILSASTAVMAMLSCCFVFVQREEQLWLVYLIASIQWVARGCRSWPQGHQSTACMRRRSAC
jgi:hypothetical protein